MKFTKIRDVNSPYKGTDLSAGIDFYVPNDFLESVIKPGESVLIPTGIKAKIPKGHALIAFNKSGIAVKRKLLVGACVVDEDYQGEIHIDLKNVGLGNTTILPGERLVQFLMIPIYSINLHEVESEDVLYDSASERGEGGFGSTGTR